MKKKQVETPLSIPYLKKRGFGDPQPSTFENIACPYMAMGGVLMFYNEGDSRGIFLIGHGQMRGGAHHITTFRWITTENELEEIFKAVNGYTIDELVKRRGY